MGVGSTGQRVLLSSGWRGNQLDGAGSRRTVSIILRSRAVQRLVLLKCRTVRRLLRASRPAGDAEQPQPFGFPATRRVPDQGEHLEPGGELQASETTASQIRFWSMSCKGRF